MTGFDTGTTLASISFFYFTSVRASITTLSITIITIHLKPSPITTNFRTKSCLLPKILQLLHIEPFNASLTQAFRLALRAVSRAGLTLLPIMIETSGARNIPGTLPTHKVIADIWACQALIFLGSLTLATSWMTSLTKISITKPSMITNTIPTIIVSIRITCFTYSLNLIIPTLTNTFLSVPSLINSTGLTLIIDEVFSRLCAVTSESFLVPDRSGRASDGSFTFTIVVFIPASTLADVLAFLVHYLGSVSTHQVVTFPGRSIPVVVSFADAGLAIGWGLGVWWTRLTNSIHLNIAILTDTLIPLPHLIGSTSIHTLVALLDIPFITFTFITFIPDNFRVRRTNQIITFFCDTIPVVVLIADTGFPILGYLGVWRAFLTHTINLSKPFLANTLSSFPYLIHTTFVRTFITEFYVTFVTNAFVVVTLVHEGWVRWADNFLTGAGLGHPVVVLITDTGALIRGDSRVWRTLATNTINLSMSILTDTFPSFPNFIDATFISAFITKTNISIFTFTFSINKNFIFLTVRYTGVSINFLISSTHKTNIIPDDTFPFFTLFCGNTIFLASWTHTK